MNKIRAVLKIILFVVLTCVVVPLQMLYALCQRLLHIKPCQQSPLVQFWYRSVTRILNIRIQHNATPVPANRQYLYISNHTSYLDIMVLGGLLPPFFVAKADTADWPIFGFLIKTGGTIFVSRKRALVRQQMALFKTELQNGKHLLLFPEGTTSNGCVVLPFKASLLNVLYDGDMPPIAVVPVCLTYLAINGKAFTGQADKDALAWYADMELLPHLWEVFQLRSIDVRVDVLPLLETTDYPDAKILTARGEAIIRQIFDANAPTPFDNPGK